MVWQQSKLQLQSKVCDKISQINANVKMFFVYAEVFFWIVYIMYNLRRISAADWVQTKRDRTTEIKRPLACLFTNDSMWISEE